MGSPGLDALYLRATVASMRSGPARRLDIGPDREEARLRLLDIVAAQPNSAAELRSQRACCGPRRTTGAPA